jgi:hypothetical protein
MMSIATLVSFRPYCLVPGADELPEPVVCGWELIVLAWCRCLWLAMCFFCLWLAAFFARVVTFDVSSFVALAPEVGALLGLPYCANAGEAISIAVIISPGTVSFM